MTMKIKKPTLRKGFTLIELLIVVAIIGILAVALVPTITDAPARARDAARKAAVNSVLTALESYNIDNGSYPTGNFCLNDTFAANSVQETFINNYLNGNPPTQTTPSGGSICADGNEASVRYESSDGTSYNVYIQLEKAGNASIATYNEASVNTLVKPANSSHASQIFLVER